VKLSIGGGDEIEKIGDQIMENPELGFKEFKTAQLVADTIKSFGIPHETGLAITGVKGVIRGKNSGPTVALMGELDSLLVSDHPHADSETGAAHACGHNAQIAGLMGAMMGLVDTGAMETFAATSLFLQSLPKNTWRSSIVWVSCETEN